MTLTTRNTQNNIELSTEGLISSRLLNALNNLSDSKNNSPNKSLNLSDISSILSTLDLSPTDEYTDIAYAPLIHIILNKNLTPQDKLAYIITDIYAAKTISYNPSTKRSVTFAAKKLSEIINYSERTALRVEQKLEQLGYFKIERSKNLKNRNNVNIITPDIPDHVFKDLIHKNIRNNIDISEYDPSNIDLSSICKRSVLDKIGQYISFNMDFVRKVAFSDELTAFQKIQCIHLYIILHLVSTKRNRFGYYGFLELNKLQKQLQIGRTSFFNLLYKLTEYGFIQREQFFVQDITSEEEINKTSLSKVDHSRTKSNRYDKSIWKFTITLSDRKHLSVDSIKTNNIVPSDINKQQGNIVFDEAFARSKRSIFTYSEKFY